MTIRFNLLAGCESGIVKGIDTTNNGIYVIHKPAETYADAVTILEWSQANNDYDYMQVNRKKKKLRIIFHNLMFVRHISQPKRTISLG
jgi:hypothetical protein